MIKKNVNVPVIVVNDINTPERSSYLIENNMADMVAIGRFMLADAAWANKALYGKPIDL
jgi:NADPH2 dehydrogenase